MASQAPSTMPNLRTMILLSFDVAVFWLSYTGLESLFALTSGSASGAADGSPGLQILATILWPLAIDLSGGYRADPPRPGASRLWRILKATLVPPLLEAAVLVALVVSFQSTSPSRLFVSFLFLVLAAYSAIRVLIMALLNGRRPRRVMMVGSDKSIDLLADAYRRQGGYEILGTVSAGTEPSGTPRTDILGCVSDICAIVVEHAPVHEFVVACSMAESECMEKVWRLAEATQIEIKLVMEPNTSCLPRENTYLEQIGNIATLVHYPHPPSRKSTPERR